MAKFCRGERVIQLSTAKKSSQFHENRLGTVEHVDGKFVKVIWDDIPGCQFEYASFELRKVG